MARMSAIRWDSSLQAGFVFFNKTCRSQVREMFNVGLGVNWIFSISWSFYSSFPSKKIAWLRTSSRDQILNACFYFSIECVANICKFIAWIGRYKVIGMFLKISPVGDVCFIPIYHQRCCWHRQEIFMAIQKKRYVNGFRDAKKYYSFLELQELAAYISKFFFFYIAVLSIAALIVKGTSIAGAVSISTVGYFFFWGVHWWMKKAVQNVRSLRRHEIVWLAHNKEGRIF